jgi:predicted extracellular nuclease
MIVNNHFASRRHSSPWTSEVETPVVGGAPQREGQAEGVGRFANAKLAEGAADDCLMLGDLNDWGGSPTVRVFERNGFVDMSEVLPDDQRFDYNYRGSLQMLQPPIASKSLVGRFEVEVLHKSVFDPIDDTDHDGLVTRIAVA